MADKERIFYWLLLAASLAGFRLSYFPDVIGQPASIWRRELITTISYFTIISNLAVALLALGQLFFSHRNWAASLGSMTAQTAIAVYITMTGMVYHLLLAKYHHPEGIEEFGNFLTHSLTPALYIVFWFAFARGKTMPLGNTLAVLYLPCAFLIYWLMRGPLIGQYPYSFMDVDKLGYLGVLLNGLAFSLVFWMAGLVYWAISKVSRSSVDY